MNTPAKAQVVERKKSKLGKIYHWVIGAGNFAGSLSAINDFLPKLLGGVGIIFLGLANFVPQNIPEGTGGPNLPERPKIENLLPTSQLPPKVNELFQANFRKWSRKYLENKGDQWCAKENPDYPNPSAWYNGAIVQLPLPKVVIEYLATTHGETANTFSLGLGDDNGQEYLKVYVQEEAANLVGIEKIIDGGRPGELHREAEKRVLTNPIKPLTPVMLNLEGKVKKDNLIEYTLIITYISAETGRSIPDVFYINVLAPHISPMAIETKIGIGTVKGHCISPLRYEIY